MRYWPIYLTTILAVLQAGEALNIGWLLVFAPLWFPIAALFAMVGGGIGFWLYVASLERGR